MRPTFLIFLLFVPIFCLAEDLEVRATWGADNPAPYDKPLEHSDKFNIAIRLENTGSREIVVICKRTSPVYVRLNTEQDDRVGVDKIIYKVDYSKGLNGKINVPAESEMMLVRLQPGESTEWWVEVKISVRARLDRIEFVYRIEKDLADRFGAWSGQLAVPLRRQRE
jgi:hypothetical protein